MMARDAAARRALGARRRAGGLDPAPPLRARAGLAARALVRVHAVGGLRPSRSLPRLRAFSGPGLSARVPLRPAPPPAPTRFGLPAAAASPRGAAPFELLAIHTPAPTSPGAERDWRHDMRKLPGS